MPRPRIQPPRSKDKGLEPLPKKQQEGLVPERNQATSRMPFIKGLDDMVEMRIKPLPQRWQEDCVWISCGKIERKVKRENLHKYPDHVIITYSHEPRSQESRCFPQGCLHED